MSMCRRHHVRPYDLESETLGRTGHLIRIQGIASDPVVISKQNRLRAVLFHEHAEVLFRCHGAEVPRERKHFNMVHTQVQKHLLLFRKSGEESQGTSLLLQHITGMGPESHHSALIPAYCCSFYKLLYYKTVSDVDTVEKSSCYNHLTSSKSCL